MNTQKLTQKAQQCFAKATPIPGAPLWHMGKVAMFGSQDSLELLQKTINYLDCKAQTQLSFSEDEKEFLTELFEALWWGGKAKGYWEAATLANHFVHGNGASIQISAGVYTTSVIVKDVTVIMKQYIQELVKANRPVSRIFSNDINFRNKPYFKKIVGPGGSRNVLTQGYIRNDGLIFAEQGNYRLQKADNRFYLEARTTILPGGMLKTIWRVENIYRFNSKFYTEIPLEGKILKLPDGLSKYMKELGIAKEFNYWAEWQEVWN